MIIKLLIYYRLIELLQQLVFDITLNVKSIYIFSKTCANIVVLFELYRICQKLISRKFNEFVKN